MHAVHVCILNFSTHLSLSLIGALYIYNHCVYMYIPSCHMLSCWTHPLMLTTSPSCHGNDVGRKTRQWHASSAENSALMLTMSIQVIFLTSSHDWKVLVQPERALTAIELTTVRGKIYAVIYKSILIRFQSVYHSIKPAKNFLKKKTAREVAFSSFPYFCELEVPAEEA